MQHNVGSASPFSPSSTCQINDAKKLELVCSWLKDLLGQEEIPTFEANPSTIQFLFDLALINKQKDAERQILIEDCTERTKECIEEGKLIEMNLWYCIMHHHNSLIAPNCRKTNRRSLVFNWIIPTKPLVWWSTTSGKPELTCSHP